MMLSMFKAQLVMDWSKTTTWRTTHCDEDQVSNKRHSNKTETAAGAGVYENVAMWICGKR